MGVQATNTGDAAGVTGASVIIIEEACENSQLLVSLCRNGSEWLTPIGWRDKQKITLLDCRSEGGKTEIDIPAEFSKILKSGDKLLLTCSELDLSQEIIWETSNIQTRPLEDLSPPARAGLVSSFLSRFKSSPIPEVTATKSEAQRRAEEADIAAETYRAKMEAATAAKEEAQRRAEEAAIKAEQALKVEAERVADMERAAKAFYEAERLKQDGFRRLEEERRQEEERISGQARIIEEARKREQMAKDAAARQEALERYERALNEVLDEETHLQSRLSKLEMDAAALKTKQSEHITTLSTLQGDLDSVQSRVGESRQVFENTFAKLDKLKSEFIALETKSNSLSAERTEIGLRVTTVEEEYMTAQKEAELAVARAEEKRKIFAAAREKEAVLLNSLNAVSIDLESHKALVDKTKIKAQKSQSKFERAQADLDKAHKDITALESGNDNLSGSLRSSRIEIEAAQQSLEDCRTRISDHQAAIAHLAEGGSYEDLSNFNVEPKSLKKKIKKAVMKS